MQSTPNANYTLDDIQSDVGHLVHLLDEIMAKVLDVDHKTLSAEDKYSLNRAGAFVWIARDLAERIEGRFLEALTGEREKWEKANA